MSNWYTYWMVTRSGLFDPYYYLFNYPDVRRADMDPLMHYLRLGWKEGRNPSADFDTNFYLTVHTDVKAANICPLVHYARFGKNEGRAIKPLPGASSNPQAPLIIPDSLWIDSDLLSLISNQLSK